MQRKKIVIGITDSISAILIRGQAEFLLKNGFDVFVFSSDGEEIKRLQNLEQFTLVSIPFKREISLGSDFKAAIEAYKALTRIRPDIVNAGTPKAGFLLMIVSFILRVPIRVFTLRGIRSSSLSGIKGKVVSFTERLSCLCANKVIAISKSLKDEAVKKGLVAEKKCIVIGKGSSNGVNITRFLNYDEEETNNLGKNIGIKREHFVIGFVGRIVKEKGVLELYSAFSELRTKYKLQLILIGPIEEDDAIPTEYLDKLKNDEHVKMVAKVTDIQNYYPLFNLLVLPSYREGFGNVIIESALSSIPAVASNIPGCRDAVEHNFSGLLFESKSVEDLTRKIQVYLDNPSLLKEHGENARSRAIEYFGSETIWKGQIELYKQLS